MGLDFELYQHQQGNPCLLDAQTDEGVGHLIAIANTPNTPHKKHDVHVTVGGINLTTFGSLFLQAPRTVLIWRAHSVLLQRAFRRGPKIPVASLWCHRVAGHDT